MWTWLKLATSNIGKFLLPFIQSFFSAMGPVVAASAVNAVGIVQKSMTDAAWRDKRDAAFDLVVKDLKVQGITVGAQVAVSLINRSIEAAVAQLDRK